MHIFVAPKHGVPMQSVARVEAVKDAGLRGDRYTARQVTFIELENIEAFTRSTGLALTPDMPRRNIVTAGIRLNELRGRRFRIGEALFEGGTLRAVQPLRKAHAPRDTGVLSAKGGSAGARRFRGRDPGR